MVLPEFIMNTTCDMALKKGSYLVHVGTWCDIYAL